MSRFAVHPDDASPEDRLGSVHLGPLVRRPATRDELRHIERFLFEPGYAMAFLFLAGQPRIERDARRKAA